MRFGWVLLAGLICLVIWLARNAGGEMLKEEMQTRLSRIPNAVIRGLPQVRRLTHTDRWAGSSV